MPDALLITEEWLQSVGFRWHQLERQPSKHWLLWLGDAVRAKDGGLTATEDIGIELAESLGRGGWFCWFRADCAGRYSRFIHLRHLTTQDEVIRLVEVVSGWPWRPQDHFYGSCLSPASADHVRAEHDRMDRRLLREGHPWREIERDDSRGRALPEHMEAHAKSGVEKRDA